MILRCLVVDDNHSFLQSAKRLLEGQSMAVVGVATNGSEALQRTAELSPDVLLLDVDLGRESGFEVAERLQQQGHLPAANVIMISAHAEDDLVDLLAGSPVAGFLPKAQLSAARIQHMLEAGQRG
jgi:CheY-like chemotaxis protein